jgi:hypothetical protein
MVSPRKSVTSAILGAAMIAIGCSSQEPMPVTYPVTGSVLRLSGTPYPGGAVQFHPESDEDLTVLGDIDKDGTFRLRTIKGRQRVDGAPEGAYRVTIRPAIGADQKAPFAEFTVDKVCQIEPQENHLEIRADP